MNTRELAASPGAAPPTVPPCPWPRVPGGASSRACSREWRLRAGACGTDVLTRRRGHVCRGFSLLELIVVVALLGIVVAFAMLGAGPGQRRVLEESAGQLLGAVSLVEQESILRRRPLGISLYRTGYRVDRLGMSGPAADEDPLYRFRDLPDGVEFLHAPELGAAAGPPVFVMYPDGDTLLGEVVLADTRSGHSLRLMPRDGRLAAVPELP